MKVEVGDRRGIAIPLESLAHVQACCGALELAAKLWGRAEGLRHEIEAPLTANERNERDRQIAAARASFGDDAAFDRAWHLGQRMTTAQAVDHALEERNA